MEGKKPGVLKHLRQKMHPLLPSLLRHKTVSNKGALQTEMPHRMSSSVPDMRHNYAPVPSTLHIPRTDVSSYSSPTTPLNKGAVRQAQGGGSDLRMRGGRSEQVLCVPSDCTDWNYSRNSQSYSESGADMESEELHLPEVMTIYSPQQPSADTQQTDENNVLSGDMANSTDIQTCDTGAESPTGSDIREAVKSFLVTITLKEGRKLVVRDRCGKEPYLALT